MFIDFLITVRDNPPLSHYGGRSSAKTELIYRLSIAKNQGVIIGITAAQRDERVWGADAWKWRPERWLYGDADAKAGPGAALLDDEARYPGVYSGM